jgi:hypothetical protein
VPSSPASPAADARVRILAAGAAAQRFLAAFPEPPGPDFRAAERDLETSLRDLVPGDPLRAEVAVTLGLIRTVEHEKRCADPCPAPGELAPIVELLAIGGAREGAPLGQLYPYALTVDKLYDHTHDPGDIDLAITWLRRAAAHHGVSPGERRQALVCLAIQYANKGAWLREVQERSGPGTESWAAFGTAIGQFESVLAELAGRGRRSDPTRDEDRRDARLSLLETYYQRGGEDLRDEDLDVMAALARALIATVTPGYRLRSHALGRCGVVLIQRIMRRAGDSWDRALNTALLSGDPAPVREVIRAVPGFESDLAAAAGALTVAVGLENPDSRLHPLFLAAACAARGLEYLAYAGQNALAEFGRLCRLVMGHPRVTEYYRRTCAEVLLVVLERHLREAGQDLTALHRAAANRASRPIMTSRAAWPSTRRCPRRSARP